MNLQNEMASIKLNIKNREFREKYSELFPKEQDDKFMKQSLEFKKEYPCLMDLLKDNDWDWSRVMSYISKCSR